MENITRKTLGMNAHQWRDRVNVAHHKGNRFLNRLFSIHSRF
jgi:hypothetical protein